ncbi:MAG: ornithine carbamoyltransferase [Candidatus Portiera sp.]|nr:ornithine carbamoyltransferase [Portiera sp.]
MHFLTLADLSADSCHNLIERAVELKRQLKERGSSPQTLADKSILLLFEKPSTRTRLSFEIGISQMGGNAIFISGQDSQMTRGESIRDTARIISSMADGMMIRNNSHTNMQEFANNSQVPIINGLSSDFHPCQLLADLTTYYELRGSIAGKKVVWCGDGNNMCNSYIEAASIMGFNLVVAAPEEYLPPAELLEKYSSSVTVTQDIESAISDAALVSTDVWVSMGDKDADSKREILKPFQVTSELLDKAADDVLFMHCLPAKEGEEIEVGLLDDKRSAVWTQAENRLHAQKALLELLFSPSN